MLFCAIIFLIKCVTVELPGFSVFLRCLDSSETPLPSTLSVYNVLMCMKEQEVRAISRSHVGTHEGIQHCIGKPFWSGILLYKLNPFSNWVQFSS